MENLPDFSRYGDVVQEAPTVVADPTNPETFGGLPKQGDTGEAVFEVQQALSDRNISSVGEVDGAFGNKTSLAIQEFQEQVGLPRTGVLDQDTYTQLLTVAPSFDEAGRAKPTPVEKPEALDFASFGEVVSTPEASEVQVDASSVGDLYASRGASYKASQIKSYSYYNDTINGVGPRGDSRVHGDASKEVQNAAMEAIITQGRKAGMSNEDIALTLAISRHESGFNPDAAAGTTSAHGLGQFVDKTGAAYGLTDENRWDVNEQARALVEHTQDNIKRAEKKGSRDYVYAFHHDGPSLKYGGLAIGKANVTPRVASFLKLVEGKGSDTVEPETTE